MATLVQDPSLSERLRAERKTAGADRWDEVWDGVYILIPLPNDEHQKIVGRVTTILDMIIGLPELGEVRPGVNVSDREDWKENFRCPDVAVFLPETTAVNSDTFWLGGPDFAVEVVSPHDRSREKFGFYAAVGTRELLVIDRYPWALELYRLRDGRLDLVGRSTVEASEWLRSEVVPMSVRLVAGDDRPRIEMAHHDGRGRWSV